MDISQTVAQLTAAASTGHLRAPGAERPDPCTDPTQAFHEP